MVWCVCCERAWRPTDLVDPGDLGGAGADRRCPTASCNDGAPGGLLPYHELRRLVVVRWPRSPTPGQRYPLRSAGPAAVTVL